MLIIVLTRQRVLASTLLLSGFFGSGSFLCFSFGSGGVLFLAGLTGAAGLSLGSFFSLLGSGLLVGLLSLALFKTLGDSLAASGQHDVDGVLGVVVGGDKEVYAVGARRSWRG